MWEPSQTALPELAQYLSQPLPGLALLRYRSVHAFEALLRSLRPNDRQLHRVSYRPRADDDRASPLALVQRCRALADPAIPIIFLCPDPDSEATSDLNAQAGFWKGMNSCREALGALSAQIILTLDEAQTAACFHHAKDLISWCSPKFELATLTPAQGSGDRLTVASEKTSERDTPASSSLTWDALYPLLQQELQSGLPLNSRAVSQLLFPLMRHALDNGSITRAARLLPVGDHAAFPDERERGVWLNMKGDLAVAQGDLAGALRYFTESKTIAERLAASDPANAAWQRDLSVSLDKLGDLAVAQGDLAGALRDFTGSKTIRERLAASDPANAAWQRDLAVSHFKLFQFAQKSGDEAEMEEKLKACFLVLDGMKQRGTHLDPPMAKLHEQLGGRFDG